MGALRPKSGEGLRRIFGMTAGATLHEPTEIETGDVGVPSLGCFRQFASMVMECLIHLLEMGRKQGVQLLSLFWGEALLEDVAALNGLCGCGDFMPATGCQVGHENLHAFVDLIHLFHEQHPKIVWQSCLFLGL
jgi:hypothetical protein